MLAYKEHKIPPFILKYPWYSILFWYLKAEKFICAVVCDLNSWKTIFQIRCLLLFVFTLLNDKKTTPDSYNVLKTVKKCTQLCNLALKNVISIYFQALLHRDKTVMAGFFVAVGGVCKSSGLDV